MPRPELRMTTCSCGYSFCSDGTVELCSHCYQTHLQAQAEEAAIAAEEAALEAKRVAAEEAREKLRVKCYEPHWDKLDTYQRRLFESMMDYRGSFKVDTLATDLRVTPDEAWTLILDMVGHNVLVDMGNSTVNRLEYSERIPYAYGVERDHRFTVRPEAVDQRDEVLGPRKAPKPTPPVKRVVTVYPTADLLPEFLSDECVTGEKLNESQTLLRAAFVAWCNAHGYKVPDPMEWSEALSEYPVQADGRLRGLHLKRPADKKPLRIEQVVNHEGIQTGAIELRS